MRARSPSHRHAESAAAGLANERPSPSTTGSGTSSRQVVLLDTCQGEIEWPDFHIPKGLRCLCVAALFALQQNRVFTIETLTRSRGTPRSVVSSVRASVKKTDRRRWSK